MNEQYLCKPKLWQQQYNSHRLIMTIKVEAFLVWMYPHYILMVEPLKQEIHRSYGEGKYHKHVHLFSGSRLLMRLITILIASLTTLTAVLLFKKKMIILYIFFVCFCLSRFFEWVLHWYCNISTLHIYIICNILTLQYISFNTGLPLSIYRE